MLAANNRAPSTYAFANDAARLGALMRRDTRVQLGFLAVSGWDTHANQGGASGGQLAGLLAPFAKGMSALARSLGPLYADTMIAVISEFGRTVAQNGNAGTDHGHGNLMWLMGGPIAGAKVAFFQGEPQSMRFVSSFSLHEGDRGLPHMLEFQVISGENGAGVRLVVNELIYSGPRSTGALRAAERASAFRPELRSPVIKRRCAVWFSRPSAIAVAASSVASIG